MEITATRQFDAWKARELPPVEQVRDGVWSIPTPMPGLGLRYVLVYAFALPDGLAIVDSGWHTSDAWTALVDGLATIGYEPRHIRAMLATHIHTDHYGLAGRVRDASGAWIGLHAADAAMTPKEENAEETMRERLRRWSEVRQRMGMPITSKPQAEPEGESAGGTREPDQRAPQWQDVQRIRPDVLIGDGDVVDLPGWRLRAIWTPGHSPGHLCFHEERNNLLLAGDHVLPKISPNVAMHSHQSPNPLGDYLDSLSMIGKIDVDEVLPAHEYRYIGLSDRASELREHHHARLAEIEALLDGQPGMTTWQLTTALTWSRPLESQPPALKRTAAKEILAHLILLEHEARAHRVDGRPERWFLGKP